MINKVVFSPDGNYLGMRELVLLPRMKVLSLQLEPPTTTLWPSGGSSQKPAETDRAVESPQEIFEI